MNKIYDNSVNYATRYLGFKLEDVAYLPFLINKLAGIFQAKVGNRDFNYLLIGEDFNIFSLCYNKKDWEKLCYFERSCLDFKSGFSINRMDKDLFIDKYGFIVAATNKEILGKNVWELDDRRFRKIKEEILNNLLVSKIYQDVASLIEDKMGKGYAEVFRQANESIVFYERKMLERLKNKIVKKEGLIRQISMR